MRPLTFLLALVGLFVVMVGCEKETIIYKPEEPGPFHDLRLCMSSDTILSYEGDSAIAEGCVEAIDEDEIGISGLRVPISVTEPFVFIDYLNQELRDTTDENGRVNFRFRCYGTSRVVMIFAEYEEFRRGFPIFIIPAELPPVVTLHFNATPDSLFLIPGHSESVLLTVLIVDEHGVGVPDRFVQFSATGGRLTDPFPPTDADGFANAWWTTAAQGEYILTVRYGDLRDTATVTVNSPVSAVQIWMPTDTLAFLPGDSAIAAGWAVVKDPQGNVIPGALVNLSLQETFGALEFVDPVLRDTTNADGRVNYRFASFNEQGTQTIVAECGGHSDSWSVVVQESGQSVGLLDIALDPNRLIMPPGESDSSRVTVILADSNGVPIANAYISLTAEAGTWHPLPPTDNTGRAVTYWFPSDYGSFWVRASFGSHVAEDSIEVVSEP